MGFSKEHRGGCYIGFDNPRSLGVGRMGPYVAGSGCFQRYLSEALRNMAAALRKCRRGRFIKIESFSGARLSTVLGSKMCGRIFPCGGRAPVSGSPLTVALRWVPILH